MILISYFTSAPVLINKDGINGETFSLRVNNRPWTWFCDVDDWVQVWGVVSNEGDLRANLPEKNDFPYLRSPLGCRVRPTNLPTEVDRFGLYLECVLGGSVTLLEYFQSHGQAQWARVEHDGKEAIVFEGTRGQWRAHQVGWMPELSGGRGVLYTTYPDVIPNLDGVTIHEVKAMSKPEGWVKPNLEQARWQPVS